MIRTVVAAELDATKVGQTVTLAGWVARRRDHGGVAFIDLRDATGVAQVVVREEVAHHLRAEYCLKVTGTVQKRPEGNENPAIATGEIEVIADDVVVLYRGRVMERGSCAELLERPQHPYLQALLHAVPRLHTSADQRLVRVSSTFAAS